MRSVSKYKWVIVGVLLGAAAGYTFYYFIGCSSGSCPISSNPFLSMFYGMLMFGIMFHLISKEMSGNKK